MGKSKNTEAKNATATEPVISVSKQGMDSLDAHCDEFERDVRNRYNATASYGLQHINSLGAAHPDTLDRMPNMGLLRLASQCVDRLARREAADNDLSMLGPKTNKNGSEAEEAHKCIELLKKWMAKRSERVAVNMDRDKALRDLQIKRKRVEELAVQLDMSADQVKDAEGNFVLAQIEAEEEALLNG